MFILGLGVLIIVNIQYTYGFDLVIVPTAR